MRRRLLRVVKEGREGDAGRTRGGRKDAGRTRGRGEDAGRTGGRDAIITHVWTKVDQESGGKMESDKARLLPPCGDGKCVPAWFYEQNNDVCGLTRAAFMWWANAVCCAFHSGLAIAALAMGGANGGLATPKLAVYLTNLSWTPNATNSLVPINVPADGLLLSWMTLWFFLLSALAHGIVCVFNYHQGRRGLDSAAKRRVTRFTGWYYVWIHQCRQPLRYAL